MLRSFDSLALRQLRTRPLRSLLTGFGVVLGVGMVFGVLILASTIRHTFSDVVDSAWGKSDLVVTAEGSSVMPEDTLGRIRETRGVREAGAMAGAVFSRLGADGRPVSGNSGQILVAGYDPADRQPYDFRLVEGRYVKSGREIMLEKNWARDNGYGVGDRIRVATPTGPAVLPVIGIFKFSNGLSLGGLGIAAMPLDAARPMMNLPSGWTQISIAADDNTSVDVLQQRIERVVGPGTKVQTPEAFGNDLRQEVDALNVILYFFSGIALFVGGFLILNSYNMTVLQRMRELGMLRTLGASRGMVVRSVLLEALVVGLLGTIAGLGLGLGLAAGLVALMRGLDLPVGTLHATAGAAVIAILLGLLISTLGAVWPARRAGRTPPIRAVLGGAQMRRKPRLRRLFIGAALFLPGLLLGGEFFFGDSSNSDAGSMIGMLLTLTMFTGMVIAAPFVIMPIIRLLSVPFARWLGANGRLAADALRTNALRTSATAVALTIGLSVVVVNASMSSSFRGTVNDQIDRSFAGDFDVQAQGFALEDGGGPGVPPSLRAAIARMPETGTATPVRASVIDLPGVTAAQKDGLAMGIDPAAYGRVDKTALRDGVTREQALRDVAAGGIIIGSAYASMAKLERGDSVVLVGTDGRRRVRVAAVQDAVGPYGGRLFQMSLATMQSVYGVNTDAQLKVKARSDAARPALERRIGALVATRYPNLELQSVADRKAEVDKEIAQPFNMFNAIVAIAVIVSLLGVVNTLAMSVIERTREIGVLRALGASRWTVRRTMLDESLLITVTGALFGVLVGTLIAFVWMRGLGQMLPGIAFHFPFVTIAAVAVAAVVLGVVASLLPARRAARLKPIEALTYE